MNLPGFSIRRPVTTLMIYAGVVLFGFISLTKLPQELFPPITYPQITIITTYANAAPEEIETLITKPVEEAVGTVGGLRRLRSVSKEGVSLVMAEFDWAQNMDFAALRVREKIDLIKERLPRESEEPLVMKFNPFEMPIMTLSVTGDRPPQEIREISRRIIKDELEKIEGVASVSISGGLEREILVEVNQGRLEAQNVPILTVAKSITNANLNYPAGTIKESFYEYLIRTLGEFEHVREIEDLPVKTEEGAMAQPQIPGREELPKISKPARLVLVKDVATVYDTFKERTSFSRYNGVENVSLSVQKQAQTNTLQVISRVKEALRTYIKEEVPEDIKIDIASDQSKYIRDSINGVKDAALQGGLIVFFVLLVFLKKIKDSVIVTFSIPLSIMAAFTLMYMGGLSVNMMSLGGLLLGVGMLVDNAIVVIENIFRHKSVFNEDEKTAASAGAGEVSGAITGSTLTTVAVFLPIVFVIGIAGQVFKQLAFTVTFSLLTSLVVSLTVIPLLASRVRAKKGSGDGAGPADEPQPAQPEGAGAEPHKTGKYMERYADAVGAFLDKRFFGLFLITLIFLGSLLLYPLIDKELLPKMDQGEFIIKIDMPAGSRLEITNGVSEKIENYILSLRDVDKVSAIVGSTAGREAKDVLQRLGSHQAQIIVNLKKKRRIKTLDIVQMIKNKISGMDLEGAEVKYILQESVFRAAVEEAAPVVIELKGEKMPVLMRLTENVQNKLQNVKGVYGIKTDMPEPSPETKIFVDKDRAAVYNLSVADIAQSSQIGLRGYIASQLKEKGQEIDIRVRLRDEDRDNFDKLSRLRLYSQDGTIIPLFMVARFGRGKGPNEIKRLDQERTILISANIFKRALKDITSDILRVLKRMSVPKDYALKLAGESEEMQASFASLRFALLLSIFLVYMIMAAQFESLWQPFVIMFTVPLSLIGVLAALFVTNTSLNVVSLLGVIILGGIVVNNGIVLIDFVNLLRRRGMEMKEALIEASKARLRPIVMTALTTILALIPMAAARGEGAELRSPLAISVMGGLAVSTFLTLFVIPAILLSFENMRVKIFDRRKTSEVTEGNLRG